jgi:hypothetical protein
VDHTFLGFPFLTDVSVYSMLMNVVWNSGRELFLADASLFVDDAEAFDHYEREEQEISSSQLSTPHEEAKESSSMDGAGMTEDDEKLLAEDDDELDLDDDELDELEASVSKTSLHDI